MDSSWELPVEDLPVDGPPDDKVPTVDASPVDKPEVEVEVFKLSPPSSELSDELQLLGYEDGSSQGENDTEAIEVSPPSPPWTMNDKCYFSLVTFRVGRQLFRVPREGLAMHSKFFSDMFAARMVSQGLQSGDVDDKPIHLEGIDEDAFEDFLQLLYPPFPTKYDSMSLQPVERQTLDPCPYRWVGVLNLAHKWRFKDIRSYAISRLEKFWFDEVYKAEIAHKYEIESWYMPTYVALARRIHPLTIEEAQRLGLAFTVKMGLVREWRLRRMLRHGEMEDMQSKKDLEELRKDIEDVFGLGDSITNRYSVSKN